MKQKRGSFDQAKWYRVITAIVALVAAVGGAVAAWTNLLEPMFRVKKVADNVEIVFDRSAGMNDLFEGVPKLQAAAQSVENVLAAGPFDESTENPSNLAFREFGGGDCNDTRLTLKFSQKNKKPIQNLLGNLKAGEKSNLARAVNDALADFNDPARFSGVRKRVIVITGSDGTDCPSGSLQNVDKQGGQVESKRTEGQPGGTVALDFHFIGIMLTAPERDRVEKLSQDVGGHPPSFVDRRADLDVELIRIVVTEPLVGEVTEVMGILNDAVTSLKSMMNSINSRDYRAAGAALAEARERFDRSEASFRNFRTRGGGDRLQKLYQMVADGRDMQSRLLTLAAAMLAQAEKGNIEAYKESAQKYDEIGTAYKEKTQEIDQLNTRLLRGER